MPWPVAHLAELNIVRTVSSGEMTCVDMKEQTEASIQLLRVHDTDTGLYLADVRTIENQANQSGSWSSTTNFR